MTDSSEQPSIHHTKDGSHTLYSSSFGQYYHNPNGAIDESIHVFFETPRLLDSLRKKTSLTIFEVGFGTGLNLMLLLNFVKQQNITIPISFISVEAFPISAQIASSLNYSTKLEHIDDNILPNIFESVKPGLNNYPELGSTNITFQLYYGNFFSLPMSGIEADFIFHDPFSPEVNGDLWTVETFQKLSTISTSETILATYCAATKARAAMAKAGWHIARAQGALGKREMTLAALSDDMLSGFKNVNTERLIARFDAGEFA